MERISRYQYFCLLLSVQAGGRYLTMPREIATVASNDAWISTVIGGFWIAIITAGVVFMSSLYPNKSILEYSKLVLGKVLGTGFNLLLLFAVLSLIAIQTKGFSDIIKFFMLSHTPIYALGLVMILGGAYLSYRGLHPLANLAQLVTVPFVLLFILITILCFQRADIAEIKPILVNGPAPVIQGVVQSLAYTGPELIAGLLFVSIDIKKDIIKVSTISCLINTFRITLMVLTCLMSFGAGEIYQIVYPGATVYKTVDMPAFVITERLEAVLMVILIPFNLISTAISIYAATTITRGIFSITKSWITLLGSVVIGVSLCFVQLDVLQFGELMNSWHWFTAFVDVVAIPGIIAIAWLRNGKGWSRKCVSG